MKAITDKSKKPYKKKRRKKKRNINGSNIIADLVEFIIELILEWLS